MVEPTPAAEMSRASRIYGRIRRRGAPVVFLLGLGVLARETCQSRERAEATIVLDLGAAAAPEVRHLRADIFVDGDPVAWFERETAGVARMEFPARIEGGAGELRVALTTGAGIKLVERHLDVKAGDRVRVDLGHALP